MIVIARNENGGAKKAQKEGSIFSCHSVLSLITFEAIIHFSTFKTYSNQMGDVPREIDGERDSIPRPLAIAEL